ncbi:MAG: FliH/SctL family protein [Phycisphaerae bacterium]|jgi:flagellar biosynthesis/type III secretory pathway protein FliH
MAHEFSVGLPGPLLAVKAASSAGAAPQGPRATASQAPGQASAAPVSADKAVATERQALRQALSALQQAVEQVSALNKQILQEAEEQLLDLAVGIAGKVLQQEVDAGRYEIDPMVREAIACLPLRQSVVVRLNPQDLSRCRMAGATGSENSEAGKTCFVADSTVLPGHCVVESAGSTHHASLDDRLEYVVDALKSPE